MCGIAGYYSFWAREPDPDRLRAMGDAIAHRGRDGWDTWHDHRAGFVHRRLAIIDLSDAGRQPMKSADGRYIITFNGELYNWRELRARLNRNWRSHCDTEVALEALAEWGPAALASFNGMFAFALYDTLNKSLVLCRDHAGIKPLHFCVRKDEILFGSEIKAIRAALPQLEIDWHTVWEYLRWGLIDHSQHTFFSGVQTLMPGQLCRVEADGRVGFETWWSVTQLNGSASRLSVADATERFAELVHSSISMQTYSDVPVGITLSGGVDSGALATMVVEQLGASNLYAYTYCFDDVLGEIAPARSTADRLGITHVPCNLRHQDVPEYLAYAMRHQEAPITALRTLAHHRIYEEARKRGTLVLLEGSGGDEVSAGYPYYAAPLILDLLAAGDFEAARSIYVRYYSGGGDPVAGNLFFQCLATAMNPGIASQDGVVFASAARLAPEFREQFERRTRFERPFRNWLLDAQYIDFMHIVLPRALRYCDRASMAATTESRVPLLDPRLTLLGFEAGQEARMGASGQRLYVKQAVAKISRVAPPLPDKQVIVDPQREWLRKELRGWVEDTIDYCERNYAHIFDMTAWREAYRQYLLTDRPETSVHIWQLMTTAAWLRAFD